MANLNNPAQMGIDSPCCLYEKKSSPVAADMFFLALEVKMKRKKELLSTRMKDFEKHFSLWEFFFFYLFVLYTL